MPPTLPTEPAPGPDRRWVVPALILAAAYLYGKHQEQQAARPAPVVPVIVPVLPEPPKPQPKRPRPCPGPGPCPLNHAPGFHPGR